MKKSTFIQSILTVSSFIIVTACNKEISRPNAKAPQNEVFSSSADALTSSGANYTGGTGTSDSTSIKSTTSVTTKTTTSSSTTTAGTSAK